MPWKDGPPALMAAATCARQGDSHGPSIGPFEGSRAVELSDSYEGSLPPGEVIGTRSASGAQRKGVDREGVISIDDGALRIQPLLEPGWGRAGISYGPFERRDGLAFAVFMLNGHNTAQSENLPETFVERLDRWLRGAEVFGRGERLFQWLRNGRKRRTLRQWRWWRRTAKNAATVPRIDENLALGWFASEVPAAPLAEGHALVMHATGPDNGELWASVASNMLPVVRGVQNLQVHYVLVLRERGAAYYAASVPGANGLGAYPALRPLAIDPSGSDRFMHAGVFQSTIGQIGFRLDTRVYNTRVTPVSQWAAWYGSAHAADRCEGDGLLDARPAESGERWQQVSGSFSRTASGACATAADCVALLRAAVPSGLVHVMIDLGTDPTATAGIIFRHLDPDNQWRLTLTNGRCELSLCEHGHWTSIAVAQARSAPAQAARSLQILDDGRSIQVHLDGRRVFDNRVDDTRLTEATGVGIAALQASAGLRLSRFEAHPRACPLPPALDLGAPWSRMGNDVVVSESFEGPARDLEGKPVSAGDQVWRRTLGRGHLRVTGDGACKVDAVAGRPNPGRLLYTVEWAHAGFADLEVEITPPGTQRGQREHGRAGVVFWQDDRNFLLVNDWLNDSYGGASVSCFSCLGGFEDLYDAVWSNVGDRVRWGEAHRLRVAFDGMRLMALLDDEPVLYRALTDIYPDARALQIRRVGLIANWEWGNDTGSVFRRFLARV